MSAEQVALTDTLITSLFVLLGLWENEFEIKVNRVVLLPYIYLKYFVSKIISSKILKTSRETYVSAVYFGRKRYFEVVKKIPFLEIYGRY